MAGHKADVDQALNPGFEGETGVPQSRVLRRFALLLHNHHWKALEEARKELIRVMGLEALVDAAAVVAQFEAINRVADATGTKIDDLLIQAMKAGIGPSKLPEPERY
ncbi:MAG: hypothetical protein HY787_28645 [Deltaproteobacteria bacterium]|nr:hypothetical protein [Deltaproteobacteria bacterium]